MAAPVINPPMPLFIPIPGGFLQGRIIRIQGSVPPTAQRFAVNLQCGPNVNPRDDLALHLNPRFPEQAVIRNTLVSGQWGHEERHGHFPFHPGQGFEILLMCDANQYKVAVNGQHFTEFNFRTPAQRVTHLTADGDLMISAIYFEGHGAAAPPQVPGYMPTPMPTMPVMPTMPAMPTMPVAPGMPMPGFGAPGTAPGYSGYPSQPSGSYQSQPGYPTPGYPAAGAGHYPGQYPPGSQPYPTSAPQYPGQPPHSSGKGLGGFLDKAGTAVAGALGATGVAGLLGGLAGRSGHSSYPVGHSGVGPLGGILGSGGGGLMGTAGTAMGAAALGTALLNPKKALKQQRKAQKKALKYGLPIAGAGLGAYALHKGMKHGFHHGSSSSSSSSEEE